MAGGNLGWEDKPLPVPVPAVEHRSNRDEQQRKPQTPSEIQTQQMYQQQQVIQQRNSRPELTDLVEAMNNLRARKSFIHLYM
jgi:uncharacterized FlaG/YvyC family protein